MPQSVLVGLAFGTQPGNGTAGSILSSQPVVAVKDSEGNTVTSATSSVTVAITSGSGTNGASLAGTRTVTAVNGIAAFTDLRIDTTGSDYSLTASSSGLTSAVSSSFGVSSGPASFMVLTSEPSNTFVDEAFSTQPVLQIRDSYGNVITSSSAAVSASITSGSGNLFS